MPEGDGSLAREVYGKQQLSQCLDLMQLPCLHKGYFTLENIATSYNFNHLATKTNMIALRSIFDQCMGFI